jgi:hypothetical protein
MWLASSSIAEIIHLEGIYECAACGFDELRRRPGIDCIPETPQETHSGGKPINQQTNSGFNTPRFSVGADDELVIAWTARYATCFPAICDGVALVVRFSFGDARGVAHIACLLIATSPHELPASLLPFLAGASAVGVGHNSCGPWTSIERLICFPICTRR